MRHKQEWKSEEDKAKAWLELCEFSFQLMKEGIKLTNPDASPEDEALARLEKLSMERHKTNEKILRGISRSNKCKKNI